MKKFILSFALLVCAALTSFGQISEGQPTFNKMFTGNRPTAGTYGVFLGVSTDMIDEDFDFSGIPIINFKKMVSDNLEKRISIVAYNHMEKTSMGEDISRDGSGHYYVAPGVAKHFSRFNILDVYVGAEGFLGLNTSKEVSKSVKVSSFIPNVGVGCFIGFQAFVGNLPLAIGVEYGLKGQANLFDRYKIQTETSGSNQVFYSDHRYGNRYESYNSSSVSLEQEARITLSYFFKQ